MRECLLSAARILDWRLQSVSVRTISASPFPAVITKTEALPQFVESFRLLTDGFRFLPPAWPVP